jgi:hypothetical protein
MAHRFQLPHSTCMGFDVPRADGRVARTYHADPRQPGTVLIRNERDAALAGATLGQRVVDECAIVRLGQIHCTAPSQDCPGCGRENWSWVRECPRCHMPAADSIR